MISSIKENVVEEVYANLSVLYKGVIRKKGSDKYGNTTLGKKID